MIREPDAAEAARPTPEAIDAAAREYLAAKAAALLAQDHARQYEEQLTALVTAWGAVPPNAEKSRRLNGRLAELTLTRSDSITVNPERVETLREALYANGHGEFFARLFAREEPRYTIVDGAESALKQVALPRRLAEKVLNLFGRCITVKPKKPTLKVVIADPAKPARRTRAKEARV